MNKIIWLAMTVFFGANSYGDSSSFADSWLSRQAEEFKVHDFLGKTKAGKPCGLFISNKGSNIYFVVVGYKNSKDLSDYIGVINTQSGVRSDQTEIAFASPNSWGNDTSTNFVRIELDSSGSPVRAVGISDLKRISCTLE